MLQLKNFTAFNPACEQSFCAKGVGRSKGLNMSFGFLFLKKLIHLIFYPTPSWEKPAFAWSCKMEREWKLWWMGPHSLQLVEQVKGMLEPADGKGFPLQPSCCTAALSAFVCFVGFLNLFFSQRMLAEGWWKKGKPVYVDSIGWEWVNPGRGRATHTSVFVCKTEGHPVWAWCRWAVLCW